MGARIEYMTLHAWYWMQTWRFAPRAGEAGGAKRLEGRLRLPPESEEVMAAARLLLPPRSLFADRLGLDLGIDTTFATGKHRHL